ncbi:hypothetical protein [Frigoriglobus tundricola]|uniref:DUF5678 domain-containing protein n=1 Tax=Frigoriglobus tundricola TaxID=2774151 RepID=A0A6M5YX37_9BACT|nr:hypothetical protein [Frigoriglobus tundricola]QJW97956.1 hypothetical protein FTUN_5536 [Frigoriglobus tundricola]
MSAPDPSGPATATAAPPDPTPADADALFASAFWFDTHATAELIEPYRGMHVAILGEQIIDADSDKESLFRRLDAQDALPPYRVLIRYVPTEEEAWSGLW